MKERKIEGWKQTEREREMKGGRKKKEKGMNKKGMKGRTKKMRDEKE